MRGGLWGLTTLLLSLIAVNQAFALCDHLSAEQRFDQADLVADVLIENLGPGTHPGHVVATVVILNAFKGERTGGRVKVLSAYNQSEIDKISSTRIALPLVGDRWT